MPTCTKTDNCWTHQRQVVTVADKAASDVVVLTIAPNFDYQADVVGGSYYYNTARLLAGDAPIAVFSG